MKANKKQTPLKSYNIEEELFLKQLGKQIKSTRENAGYTTPEAFACAINMSRSQYANYELGKNMKILTLRNIFLELGLPQDHWLTFPSNQTESDKEKHAERINKIRLSQVMSQASALEKGNVAIDIKKAQRYVDILLNCMTPQSRSTITRKILKLEDSYNALQRNTDKIIEYGWLAQTEESKNSPNQAYYTTKAGREVLRLRQEDENQNSK